MASTFESLPLIPTPFASGGDRETFAEGAAVTNRATWLSGWGSVTSTPVAQGGRPPVRSDFNELGFVPTAFGYHMQNGGFFTFDTAVSNKIGGYPQGAILWVLDANNNPLYAVRSLVANNTHSDLTDTTYWKPLTPNLNGGSMLGHLNNLATPQLFNAAIVEQEPATGEDGVIYCVLKQQ